MSKLIRTALGALAVASMIAVAGAGSAAAADTARTPGQEPRLPVVDGRTVTHVEASGTHGPAEGSINTKSACEGYATAINERIESGLKDLHGGNMSGAGEKFGEAVKLLNEGQEVGCTFV